MDDGVVYTLAVEPWLGFGTDCAGSTERCVVFDPPIGIASGQTLALNFESCPECAAEIFVSLNFSRP